MGFFDFLKKDGGGGLFKKKPDWSMSEAPKPRAQQPAPGERFKPKKDWGSILARAGALREGNYTGAANITGQMRDEERQQEAYYKNTLAQQATAERMARRNEAIMASQNLNAQEKLLLTSDDEGASEYAKTIARDSGIRWDGPDGAIRSWRDGDGNWHSDRTGGTDSRGTDYGPGSTTDARNIKRPGVGLYTDQFQNPHLYDVVSGGPVTPGQGGFPAVGGDQAQDGGPTPEEIAYLRGKFPNNRAVQDAITRGDWGAIPMGSPVGGAPPPRKTGWRAIRAVKNPPF